MADPGFPDEGAPTPNRARQPIILAISFRKVHQIEKNWTGRGRRVVSTPWIRQCKSNQFLKTATDKESNLVHPVRRTWTGRPEPLAEAAWRPNRTQRLEETNTEAKQKDEKSIYLVVKLSYVYSSNKYASVWNIGNKRRTI